MRIIKVIINKKFEPIIINQNGLPNYLMLRYVTLFENKKAYRTKYLTCKSYIYFNESIINSDNIDLQELIISGDFLRIKKQLVNFSSWLSINVNSNINHNIYLLYIKKILKWAIYIYDSNNKINVDNIDKLINYQLKDVKSKNRLPFFTISDEIIANMLNYITPKLKENIFDKKNQVRNYLIFILIYETGIRISELLNLKINDFIRHENKFYININKSLDETEDSRWNMPTIKNSYSIRYIGISEETYLIFEEYIKFNRKKETYKFLFTSQRGLPLSKSMLSKIFDDVSKKMKFKISPHFFRHQFATKLIQFLIEEKALDIERAKDELRIICGWSLNSNMPLLYTKTYLEMLANKNNLERISNEYKYGR